MELLPGRAEGKHGRSPTVTLGDEMHEWTTTALLDTLRQGTGARLQPIELTASTAGLRTNEIGYGLFGDSLAILDGRIDDASTLVVIFAAEPEDDPFDEATWPKANPSLGLSPTVAFLRSEAALARNNPRREAQFKCYHLNQWIDQEVRWLPLKIWDQGAPDREAWRTRWQDLKGRRCKLAFDVSATQDITGLVLRFDPEEDDEPIKLICRAWIPEDTLAQREKNGREAWSKWIASGALETTPGNWVDQDYLKKAIEEALTDFDVEQIGFDPWNARKLVSDLVKSGADETLFVEMRQGILTLGEGSKQFETRVFNKTLDHGGHPLLRWMAGHCVIRFDENLNFMPSKKRSRDKIDLIVCAVMTEALSLVDVDTEIYADGRDMVII
jgi:phage terminase large subunit-like protein